MRISLTFITLVLISASLLWADIPGFWLDSPGYRNNAHDPKSPLYRDPTAIPTLPSATLTPSPTPTITPTFTASPPWTPTNSPSNSPSPTQTSTASPSPSITPSPTLSPYVYYDGDSPGALLDGINRVPWTVTPVAPGGSTILSVNETSSGGAQSGFFQGRVNIRSLGYPVLGGVGNTTGASVDVTSYNALSLWMRSIDGCFEPTVMLHSPGSINIGSSVLVTATAYTNGAFSSGVWRHVVIPLAAFNGTNAWGNPYNLATNANLVDAVMVAPSFPRNFHYFAAGPYWVFRDIPPASYTPDTVDLDDVQFQALPPLAIKQLSPIFDAFISPDGITQWGTSWSTFSDSFACVTPTSSFSFPAAGAVPVDGISGPLNACFSGHISGTLGAADGATAPCVATDLSSLGMGTDLKMGGAPVSLTTVSELSLTAGAIKGLSFYLKNGPSASAVDVDIVVRKASVAAINDGAHYRHRVQASALSAGTWTYFQIDFPPIGVAGTNLLGSFGQPAWAAGAGASAPWDTTDVLQLQVMPAPTTRGQNFDILVGQIAFY